MRKKKFSSIHPYFISYHPRSELYRVPTRKKCWHNTINNEGCHKSSTSRYCGGWRRWRVSYYYYLLKNEPFSSQTYFRLHANSTPPPATTLVAPLRNETITRLALKSKLFSMTKIKDPSSVHFLLRNICTKFTIHHPTQHSTSKRHSSCWWQRAAIKCHQCSVEIVIEIGFNNSFRQKKYGRSKRE